LKRIFKHPIGIVLAILIMVPMLIGTYAVFIEPARLVVRHVEIPTDDQSIQEIRLAIVSDLHVGSPLNGLDKLERVVSALNEEEPDLILLLGDFLISRVRGGAHVEPGQIGEGLAALSAPLGDYSVLGNHDWWEDGKGMQAALEANGISVLENTSLLFNWQGQDFYLVGLADDSTRRPSLATAYDEVPEGAPSIVMTHDPAAFLELPAIYRPELLLAGHTHGGQIYLPWLFDPIVPGRAGPEWAAGLVYVGGIPLFVTSGVGTSILPIRFNRPPEIVILTLHLPAET